MRSPLFGLWPFLVGAAAAFAALPIGATGGGPNLTEAAVAAALVLGVAASALAPWWRMPHALVALPILACFGAVALLRDADGGAVSGYSPLVLLPVFWIALHGSRRAVLASLFPLAATFVVPIFADPTHYPSAEWRRVLLWLVVMPVIGLTTQRLVSTVKEMARADPLTRLPNRRVWEERLPLALALASRAGRPLSVAMLDLDGFKAYNDTLGHLAGDRLLGEVADACSGAIRSVDLLARLGGDEFGLLLPGAPREAAAGVVERAVAAAKTPISAGVVEWDRSEGQAALLARADAALYVEKAARSAVSELPAQDAPRVAARYALPTT